MMDNSDRLANGLDMVGLGERIRMERVRHHLSLAALAERAGVSRSMLSAVERGAKVPTVLVLDRIATGLDTSISRLLGEERAARVIVRRRDEQDFVRDPTSWERRILSPVLPGLEFEFMRTLIPPSVDAGVFSPHTPGSREYLAMESGTLLLTIDGVPYTLHAGDAIYYAGDCMHSFVNPGKKPCIYYLTMDVTGSAASTQHRSQAQEADGRVTAHVSHTRSPAGEGAAGERFNNT